MNKIEKENEILSQDLQKAIFDNDLDDVEELLKNGATIKAKNVNFLIQKVTEKDTRVVYLCLVNLTTAYMENSEKVKPIIDLLVPHITQDGLFKIFDALKEKKSAKDYLDYLHQSWLVANLKINEIRVKQPKI
jgi:hypothetical protein